MKAEASVDLLADEAKGALRGQPMHLEQVAEKGLEPQTSLLRCQRVQFQQTGIKRPRSRFAHRCVGGPARVRARSRVRSRQTGEEARFQQFRYLERDARQERVQSIDLTIEKIGELADGTTYRYWTFNGQVPGPFVRVRSATRWKSA
jgi:hypothetical protein